MLGYFSTCMCRPSEVPRYATARPLTGTTVIEVTKVFVSSLCQYSNLWTNWVTCRRYFPSFPSWIPSCGSQSSEEVCKETTDIRERNLPPRITEKYTLRVIRGRVPLVVVTSVIVIGLKKQPRNVSNVCVSHVFLWEKCSLNWYICTRIKGQDKQGRLLITRQIR